MPSSLGKKKLKKDAVLDLAVNLGCLWGQTVCDELGWEWCCLMLGDGRETYVIVTPNRSHIVSPMDFVLEQLQKRLPEENTSMLLFNMLKGKKFGSAQSQVLFACRLMRLNTSAVGLQRSPKQKPPKCHRRLQVLPPDATDPPKCVINPSCTA